MLPVHERLVELGRGIAGDRPVPVAVVDAADLCHLSPEGLLEGFDRATVVHGSASAVISISAPAPAPVSAATAVGTATGRPRPDCRPSTRTVTPQEGPHRQ
ncbi:hypothetical protein CVA01_11730 [Corynebacterium variabile]|uniref:Uncharacterized protein n=1 Tax=Corynebacterium variabile TaxID=1727 RepID=A0A4Y4C250_9CORY|nr:hypothetical protein CVA01_11730 [Corynebacterium variabile]